MADNVQNMSLANVGLNFQQFNPFVYTPVKEDMSLLANSLAQQEARENAATEQMSKFNTVATQLETLVNPKENEWVQDYIEKSSKSFKDSIAAGNYSTAMKQAVLAGSNLMKAPEAVGRIKAQENFKKELDLQRKRLEEGKIRKETYDWWLKQNPYKYEDEIINGKIIGGTENPITFTPVNDIDMDNVTMLAFKFINPDSTNTQNTWSKESNKEGDTIGKKPNQVVVGKNITEARSGTRQHSKKQITTNDILKIIPQIVRNMPDGYAAIEQRYKVEVDKLRSMRDDYDRLKAQYEANPTESLRQELENQEGMINVRAKAFCRTNNKIPKYEEFFANEIAQNLLAEGLAHIDTSTITSYSSTTRVDTSGGNPGSPNPDDRDFTDGNNDVDDGPKIGWATINFSSEAQNQVSNSQQKITGKFN